MAGIFGKIFVGIYVEIKRSDGTLPHTNTHLYTPPSCRRVRMRAANDTAHRRGVFMLASYIFFFTGMSC